MPAAPTLIGSVQRALHLVDAVGASEKPMTAKALARATGLHLPTTYHLLRTLVHEGYLCRADGGYVLGPSVVALSHRSRTQQIGERVRPMLRTLHDELHAATYLTVYEDGEIRLVDVVDGPQTPRVDLWVDLHDSGHATALGKATLSALDEGSRRDYLSRHEMPDLTPYTVTDRRTLLARLEAGPPIALDKQEYSLGTACVAAPVAAPGVAAAVAVSVPASRLPRVLERSDALPDVARVLALALADIP